MPIPDAAPPARHRPPARARRGWRVAGHALRGVFLVVVMLPLVFALVAALGLVGREVDAPDWLRARVEAEAARALQGGSLTFGQITLTVPADLHVVVRLRETELRDAAGEVLARVPEIEARLSPRGLILRRQVLAQEVTFRGAQLALRRAEDGRFLVAFGGAAPATGTARPPALGTFPELLERFDRLFEQPALEALRAVRIEDLAVAYDDARAGRRWRLADGTLTLDLSGAVNRLTGRAALVQEGGGRIARATFSYESPRESLAARLGATVSGVETGDIASQLPALGWLALIEAPVSAALRGEIGTDGQLGPINAALKIGEGALVPAPGAEPLSFDGATAYLGYDPLRQALEVASVEVRSDWGRAHAAGTAILSELGPNGMPETILGQLSLTELSLNPAGAYAEPLNLPLARADFRLHLRPFVLDLAELTVLDDPAWQAAEAPSGPLTAFGRISADPQGWSVSLDARAPRIAVARTLALWPVAVLPQTRQWFADNILAGQIRDVAGALRLGPDRPLTWGLSFSFAEGRIRALPSLPQIVEAEGAVLMDGVGATLILDQGRVQAPQGGMVDLAGSTLRIPRLGIPDPPAEFVLRTASGLTAALSVLDLPPLRLMQAANLPVALADGQHSAVTRLNLPLRAQRPGDRPDYSVQAALRDVTSEVLVPGRRLAASNLTLEAEQGSLTIEGPARLGAVPMQARLEQAAGRPVRVTAEAELSQRTLQEFDITLPDGFLTGEGRMAVDLTLPGGEAPRLSLASDLQGITLALPAIGWRKGPGATGAFRMEARLGPVPEVSRLLLQGGGLSAEGSLDLTASGGLDRLRLPEVTLDDWFAGAVTLRGRPGQPVPAIEATGGTLDLGRAEFGEGGGAGGGGPIRLTLDRLRITDTIALRDFTGEFDASGGFEGSFEGLLNGGPPVRGSVLAGPAGLTIRAASDQGGEAVSAMGLIRTATGGRLDLTLTPTGAAGTWDGRLALSDLRVREAPVLASLLNAVSVVGLLQQMGGMGLVFDTVDARFRLDPAQVTLAEASAIGAGLGISLDGVYTFASSSMDFQGVISPFYLLNGIGSVLTRPGEGLIGFNFTLQGTPEAMAVQVNPLSILTPGMFREIFRRPAPVLAQ